MIDANTLLNPDYANAELRAYAFVSTQYSKGVRSPVDCLQPFVIQAIASFRLYQLDWRKVRDFLKEKYSLTIPFYMLERMTPELVSVGALERSDISKLYICNDATPTLEERQVDLSADDFVLIGDELTRFADRKGLNKPVTATSWGDLFIPFFLHRSPPQDKAHATVKGVLISDPKSFDFTVVAEFIVQEFSQRSSTYAIIERIFYGVLVADFLTQMETAGNKASFKGLGVVYDAPVLLRLLGCSGSILQEATRELHDSLGDLGCRFYYFRHSYDELSESIEAILKCYENGSPMFRETQEAIARGEITIKDIYSIRAELDLRLSANLGIIEHGADYGNRRVDEYQIDEAGFKDYLQKNRRWGASGSLAAQRDAMSLALVMRLRHGKQVRDVSKSGFVFVTHNVRLASVAKDFLREGDQLSPGSVWPMMTVGQLSTIAWVVNETIQDERRVSKELIANCYAATLPDQDFDQRLKDVLTQKNAGMAHELYQNAFVVQSIRAIALEQTSGYSALIKNLNTAEILAEAEKVRNEAIEAARREERGLTLAEANAHHRSINLQSDDARRAKAERVGSGLAKTLMGLILVGAGLLISEDYGLFGRAAENRGIIKTGFLSLLGIYAAADLFGVISAASLRRAVAKRATAAIASLQRAIT